MQNALKLILLAFLVYCGRGVSADSQNAACDLTAGPPLHARTSDVYRFPNSFLNDTGTPVTFEALSMFGIQKKLNDIGGGAHIANVCIRFGFINTSEDHTITDFGWEDIGLPILTYPIEPGSGISDVSWPFRKKLSYPAPKVTHLRAFTNSHANAEILWPVQLSAPETYRDDIFEPLELDLLPDDLLPLKREFNVDPSVDFRIPPDSNKNLPNIGGSFVAPDGTKLEFESSVEFDGEKVEFVYKVHSSGESEIVSPYISFLREFTPEPTIENTKVLIEKSGSFFTPASGSDGMEASFFVDPKASEFEGSSVFQVSHPITFSGEGGKACVIAKFYSPLPLGMTKFMCSVTDDERKRFFTQ